MTETLLRSLRDRLLDESEPLAGLLRACLMLGAETGSDSLRIWARSELNGYDEGADLPTYRMLPTPIIEVDYVSGSMRVTNQPFNRLELPAEAQKGVAEYLPLHQPIEELEKLAAQKSLSFTGFGLAFAQTVWNKELGWPQQITGMRFSLSGSAITGVLGQIRTHLVDVVADLTADTPLAELPRKDQVDAAMGNHIGAQYNTTIHAANGPTAIGDHAATSTEGLSIDDALRLLDAVISAAATLADEPSRAEVLKAVDELRATVDVPAPDTGAVIKKAGRLKVAVANLGSATLSAAVGGAVEALTSLALSGAFG